jgi:hypothetical protein
MGVGGGVGGGEEEEEEDRHEHEAVLDFAEAHGAFQTVKSFFCVNIGEVMRKL